MYAAPLRALKKRPSNDFQIGTKQNLPPILNWREVFLVNGFLSLQQQRPDPVDDPAKRQLKPGHDP